MTLDYLVKDDTITQNMNEKGYYVSMEKAKGYLTNEKKVGNYISIGFMFLVSTGIPYVSLPTQSFYQLLGMGSCIVLGIVFIVLGIFAEQEDYKILKQEPLLFEYECLQALTNEYKIRKQTYIKIAIPSTICLLIGLFSLVATKRGILPMTQYHSLAFLLLAIGILGILSSACRIDAYELLVKNEQYSARLLFKIKKKMKAMIQEL